MITPTLTASRPQPQTQNRTDQTILGIDPGYARLGVGVIAGPSNKPEVKYYGCLETDAHLATANRLNFLFQRLEELVQTYRPSIVAIERLFFHNNSKTAMGVAEVRGIILLAAARANVHTLELTPPEIKLAVTGTGSADKSQIQKLVTLILSLKEIPKPDDAADALAIALAAQTKIHSIPYGLAL